MADLHPREWVASLDGYVLDSTATCAICLENCTDLRTSCGHLFHLRCLTQWMARSKNCPMCKNEHLKTFRKFCKKCGHHFVKCSASQLPRYLAQFYETCVFCKDEVRRFETVSQMDFRSLNLP
jgi:hypothetical protein